MSDWPLATLGELAAPKKHSLATGPFGSAVGAKHFLESGVPLIRGSNLSADVGQRLLDREIVFLSEDKASEFRRSEAVRGDLVFTCWGTIGQIGLLDERARFDRYIVSNKQMKLTPDTTKVDVLYLYYALSSPAAIAAVQAIAIGSSVPGFNLGQLREVKIPLPPLSVQIAIAEVLGALDDKIDWNAVVRRSLRDMGFARLDEALERASIELAVGDLAESLARGLAPRYTEPGVGALVLNQRCIRDGWASLEAARWMQDVVVPDRKKAQRHDIVVNSTGVGTLGRVARWIRVEPIAVDGHVTVVRPSTMYSPVVVGYAMLAAELQITALGEGSTGQTELSRARLAELRIRIPAQDEASRIAGALEAIDDEAEAFLNESRTLATLRDTLLPPLLSGELRVRDAETMVREAV